MAAAAAEVASATNPSAISSTTDTSTNGKSSNDTGFIDTTTNGTGSHSTGFNGLGSGDPGSNDTGSNGPGFNGTGSNITGSNSIGSNSTGFKSTGLNGSAAGIAGPSSAFKRESRLRSLSGTVDIDYTDAVAMSPLIGWGDGLGHQSDGSRFTIPCGADCVHVTPGGCKSRLLARESNMRYQAGGACTLDCCAQGGVKRRYSSPLPARTETTATTALIDADRPMTFDKLPTPCKTKVFSFLSPLERGAAALVSRDWSQLVRQPGLWAVIDLSVFPPCAAAAAVAPPGCPASHSICTVACYHAYRTRISRFLRYLIAVKPVIRLLRFSLDIGDSEDGWMEFLQELLKVARCRELLVAELTWTETPAKRAFLPDTSVTWSNSDYKELTFRRRHRQRHFVRLFDLFTAMAPNLTSLRLPFDWSERTRQVIGRLRCLRDLDLRKYFQYGHLEPAALRAVVLSAPALERLTLELWTEAYGGFSLYDLASPTLTHLDVSACRGVSLASLSLPRLRVIRVTRHPMTFSVGGAGEGVRVVPGGGGGGATPCVHAVLCAGAPGLERINDHVLRADWTAGIYPELEAVLCAVCSCQQHNAPMDE